MDFRNLCDKIIEIQGHNTCVLSFSCGKDAISAFLRILESGKFEKQILFYFYLIPGLSWVDEYIEYFENRFGVKIHQFPNPNFYKMMKNYVFQPPERTEGIKKLQSSGDGFIDFKFKHLSELTIKFEGLSESTLTAMGITCYDSPLRRTAIKKYGEYNLNSRKWYPVHDFKLSDIREIIKRHGLKLPDDYDLFGLSFDGLDYRFVKPIKEKRPEDYKRIKEYFPLIDLQIARQERYLGDKVRRGRFNGL